LRALAGDVAVDHGGGVARRPDFTQDGLLLDLPAVPDPDRHVRPAGCGRLGAEVQVELAGLLARAVDELPLLERLVAGGLEQLRLSCGNCPMRKTKAQIRNRNSPSSSWTCLAIVSAISCKSTPDWSTRDLMWS